MTSVLNSGRYDCAYVVRRWLDINRFGKVCCLLSFVRRRPFDVLYAIRFWLLPYSSMCFYVFSEPIYFGTGNVRSAVHIMKNTFIFTAAFQCSTSGSVESKPVIERHLILNVPSIVQYGKVPHLIDTNSRQRFS